MVTAINVGIIHYQSKDNKSDHVINQKITNDTMF